MIFDSHAHMLPPLTNLAVSPARLENSAILILILYTSLYMFKRSVSDFATKFYIVIGIADLHRLHLPSFNPVIDI